MKKLIAIIFDIRNTQNTYFSNVQLNPTKTKIVVLPHIHSNVNQKKKKNKTRLENSLQKSRDKV